MTENRDPGGDPQAGHDEASSTDESTGDSSSRARKALTAVKVALGTIVVGALIQVLTGAVGSGWATISARFFDGEPLSIAVRYTPNTECNIWVIPKPPQALDVPAWNSPGFHDWVVEHAGIDAKASTVQLTIRGNSAKAIVLHDIRIVVRERRKPVQGTTVSYPCAGGIFERSYETDLDERRPELRIDTDDMHGDIVPFPYQVTQGDPEVITIDATTTNCDCSWVAELVWVEGDEVHTTIIDNNGEPFRTTAVTENRASTRPEKR